MSRWFRSIPLPMGRSSGELIVDRPAPTPFAPDANGRAVDEIDSQDVVVAAKRTLRSFLRTPDAYGILAVLLLTAFVAWDHLTDGRGLYRLDIVTAYLPWYTYLGQHLRHGDIPGWLPASFSGSPFAGDPQSGWMYLPVMAIFAVLPGVTGFGTLIVFHLLLAGLSTYVLARVLGMVPIGAVVAATAYEFGGFIERVRCCTIHAEVGAWLPLAFLGIELAVRSRSWFGRVGWWAVAGLAVSQMIAGWIGQGAYYGLLAACAYIAYRTLIAPPAPRRIGRRLADAALHGGAIVAIALGLAAGALWPRFVTVAETNLAGGNYSQISGDAANTGGWSILTLMDRLLSPDDRLGRWYLGGAIVALAIVAPFVARRRYGVPFFAVFSLIAMILTLHEGPLHHLFYLLPRFRQLHQHLPDHILTVFYIGPALLAGATVSAVQPRPTRWRLTALALVPVAVAGLIDNRLRAATAPGDASLELHILPATLASIAAVSVLLVLLAWVRPARLRLAASLALVLVVFWDPTGKLVLGRLGGTGFDAVASATVSGYTEASGAGAFLQARQAEASEPFRFFGYDPLLAETPPGGRKTYVSEYRYPETMALLLNNQAILLGLQDIQGYNPVQLSRYSLAMGRVNGEDQGYHYLNVLTHGWNSPVLRLLNVRYVVVPNQVPPGRPDLLHLSLRYRTVYADARVRVLAVDDALPRAWIVHDLRRVKRGTIFSLLRRNEVDPGQTVLLDKPPPETGQPADQAQDRATIVEYEPEQIRVATSSDAAGMLVLSEVYHPDWHAYVDGKPVQTYVADRVLRGVPIPAGVHVVELRYDQPSLRFGLLVSTATALLVGTVVVVLGLRDRRSRRIPSGPMPVG